MEATEREKINKEIKIKLNVNFLPLFRTSIPTSEPRFEFKMKFGGKITLLIT
jgi:hypothetical protein